MEAIWPLSPFQSETNSTSDPDIKGLFITRAGLWFQIQFSWCFHCGFPAWRPPGRTPAAGPAPAAAHTVCPAGPGRGQRRDAGSDTGRRAARHSSAARHGSAAGGGAESPSRTDPAATWRKRTPQKHREPAAGRVAPATPRAAQEGNGQRRAGDKGRKDKQRQWRWPPRRRSADKAQVGSAARPSRQRPTGHRASGAATQPQAGRGWAATPARERGWRRQSPPPSCLPPHTYTHTQGRPHGQRCGGQAPPGHRGRSRAGSSAPPSFLSAPQSRRRRRPLSSLPPASSPPPAPGAHLQSRAARRTPAAAATAPWRGATGGQATPAVPSRRAPPPPPRTAQQVNQPSPVTSGRHPPQPRPDGRSVAPTPGSGTCCCPPPVQRRCAARRGRRRRRPRCGNTCPHTAAKGSPSHPPGCAGLSAPRPAASPAGRAHRPCRPGLAAGNGTARWPGRP